MSRPVREMKIAKEWLKTYLSRGPASYNMLRKECPIWIAWGTVLRAKKELSIVSEAFWMDPTVSVPGVYQIVSLKPLAEAYKTKEEEPEPEPEPIVLTEQQKRDAIDRLNKRQSENKHALKMQKASKIDLWLQPDPGTFLQAFDYYEIDAIKTAMRQRIPESSKHLQEGLLDIARYVQKTKYQEMQLGKKVVSLPGQTDPK